MTLLDTFCESIVGRLSTLLVDQSRSSGLIVVASSSIILGVRGGNICYIVVKAIVH